MKRQIDKSVLITSIIVLGIIFLSVVGWNIFNSLNPGNTISASGISSIKVMPDVVSVYLGIDTKGTNSSEANSKNAEI